MTYDEAKKFVNGMVAEPEKIAETAVTFLKELESDYTTAENMKAENGKLTERIKTLQDTNQRLFLMTTGQSSNGSAQEADEDLTPLQEVDNWIGELAKQ